jgi:hypothetical protein
VPLLVHVNKRVEVSLHPRSPSASKVEAARELPHSAGVFAGPPYGREAMDVAMSGASEGWVWSVTTCRSSPTIPTVSVTEEVIVDIKVNFFSLS